jgi:Uri superfamily endonuclease
MRNLPFYVDIPARTGTYALVMMAASNESFQVGSLGEMTLTPGCYIYVGSAFGPGGLRARIAHHTRPVAKPHWHIDHLRPHVELVEIWWLAGGKRREEEWVNGVFSINGARFDMRKFGATDSVLWSHLLWFLRKPGAHTFLRRLRQCDLLHPEVQVTKVQS